MSCGRVWNGVIFKGNFKDCFSIKDILQNSLSGFAYHVTVDSSLLWYKDFAKSWCSQMLGMQVVIKKVKTPGQFKIFYTSKLKISHIFLLSCCQNFSHLWKQSPSLSAPNFNPNDWDTATHDTTLLMNRFLKTILTQLPKYSIKWKGHHQEMYTRLLTVALSIMALNGKLP